MNQAIKEFGVELQDNDINSIGEGSETREGLLTVTPLAESH